MPRDIHYQKYGSHAEEPDPSHRNDPIEALLRLKAFEENGIKGSYLHTLAMNILYRFIEVHTFAVAHNHIPRSEHQKEESA